MGVEGKMRGKEASWKVVVKVAEVTPSPKILH
jgi:hypothetical protein